MRKGLIAVATAALLSVGMAACGDDNKDESSSTTVPTVTQTETTQTETQTQTQDDQNNQNDQNDDNGGDNNSGSSDNGGSSVNEEGLKKARDACTKGAKNIPDEKTRNELLKRCEQIGK